jgi:DNA polymerase-3 subunit gamma/tau
MAHRVISLKYRPQDFDGITGQSHVVMSLKGAIKRGAIGHAFLFSGPRGVGKTTTARILAKSLNCAEGPTVTPCLKCQSCLEIAASRSIDVIEIDGASNGGIDEIRNLRESIKYSPLHGRYKVYIIDEVHMVTVPAFNALLKTLEEPPVNVKFILATTNQMKVPLTIQSRCQRFVFKRLSLAEIVDRLQRVAKSERLAITERALFYVAVRADGSLRDAESILEQLSSSIDGKINEADVLHLIGFLSYDYYFALVQALIQHNLTESIKMVNQAIEEGVDILEIYRGLVGYLRKLFLLKTGLTDEYLELSADEIENLKQIPAKQPEVLKILETALEFEEMMKRSVNNRIALEILMSHMVLGSDPAVAAQPACPPADKPGAVGDVKTALIAMLQHTKPRVAGIVQKCALLKEGKTVTILSEAESLVKELQNQQAVISEALKKIAGPETNLLIGLTPAVKKETDILADKIITMFDGEEVR